MIKKIFLHDTSILTNNLGDQIIMDAVRKELKNTIENSFFINAPTHDYLGKEAYLELQELPYSIVGGTNLLSANMDKYNQWKININTIGKVKNAILMGVGWWQYQEKINRYTKFLLKSVLSDSYLHSVRDSYTKEKLNSIGINNVINTGCMTLWQLDESHCANIPQAKSDEVVMTFTDYKPSLKYDTLLFDAAKKNYKKIYVWIQGEGDYRYLKDLLGDSVEFIEPSLEAYDKLLSDTSKKLDYVGTRLHAGVRAMQHKRRTIIVSVDNRATEMGKDFNLPVIERLQIGKELDSKINSDFAINIQLPNDNIKQWKAQFQN
jgi:polysaccharide pyruvyl transferase WcaK-like protein